MPIPVAMDGRMLGGGGAGVSSYARSLELALSLLGPRPAILRDSEPGQDRKSTRAARWLSALWPLPRQARWQADGDLVCADVFRLSQIWFDVHHRLLPVRVAGPPGVMHWSYPVPIRLIGWANVYTIHDLIPLLHPELSPINRRRHARLLSLIRTTASALVTVSDASRDEIIRYLGCPPSFVVNCSQAVLRRASTAPLPDGLSPRGYLLVLGTVESRKNIAAIAAAYLASGVSVPLVLAGADGWDARNFDDLLKCPGIIRLPYLDDELVNGLLAQACALVMPSLAEGFGLPVAEAMAVGTPVITSNDGALREITGDAALLVDPRDTAQLAEAMRLIAGDESYRARLIAAGRRNAERFSPARFAAQIGALHSRFRTAGSVRSSPDAG